jgi:hypothetical protein
MNKNVGPKDRVVRIVFAILLAVLLYVGVIEGVGAIVAGVVAAYLVITALLSACLIYKLAGVDTSVEAQEYSTTDNRSGL